MRDLWGSGPPREYRWALARELSVLTCGGYRVTLEGCSVDESDRVTRCDPNDWDR